MEWVMCLGCGEFTRAIERDGGLVPLTDECSSCGGTEFKHTSTGTRVRADG